MKSYYVSIITVTILILQSINLVVFSSTNIALNSLQLGAPWPKEGRNEYRSFQSAFDIDTTFPPTEKWSTSLGSTTYGSPIIGNDGTIYIGTSNGIFYAIHGATGVIKYSFECGGGIYSTALIASNNYVYVTSADSYIYALDVTLSTKWAYKTSSSIYASPIIDASYNVYVGSYGGTFYCVNNDGSLKWSINLKSPIQQSAVFRGASIFIILNSNKLYQLNSVTGDEIKMSGGFPYLDGYSASTALPPTSFIWSIPVVDRYDNIYIGTRSGSCLGEVSCSHIFKLSVAFTSWEDLVQTPIDKFYSSGAIDFQRDLIYFVGGELDMLYCFRIEVGGATFSTDYSKNWQLYLLENKVQKSNTEIFIASPVITSGGLIIVSNTVGEIYIVQNNGKNATIIWNGYVVDGNSPVILNSVTIGADGTIYVIGSGVLYALGTSYAYAPCNTDGKGIGTSLTSTNYSSNSITCVDCLPGYYSKYSICEECLIGTYSSSNHSSYCISCQVGTTTNSFGSFSSSDCTSCDAGKYSASPLNGCSSCLPGSFAPYKGEISCSQCSPGFYTPTTESTSCQICKAGYYSTDGASECQICKAGTYSAVGSSTCSICDKGYYSTLGSAACQVCPNGKISQFGSASCEYCSPGYSTASIILGASKCVSCKWPSTTLDIEGSTSCSYYKLFLRDYENVKAIFQGIICGISVLCFVGGIVLVDERVDDSLLRISRIGILFFACLPSIETLFNALYFSEHLFSTVYTFWVLGLVLIFSPMAVFIRHLVLVRAYPYLYTTLMPDFLRYFEPFWLRITIEFNEENRKITFLVSDRLVSFQQWIQYIPMYLVQLIIYCVMISPWLFLSFLGAFCMLILGTILYQSKIMAIKKVHNAWFTFFTGRKLYNIRDSLHLTAFNESLFYSVMFYSFPQFIIQAIELNFSTTQLPAIERASLCLTVLMILWISIRTIIHNKKTNIEDIPIYISLCGLNFMHLDRTLTLPPEPLPGELPIDAMELDGDGDCAFNDIDEEIISLELADVVAESGQVSEISIRDRTESNLLGPLDFLDFWNVFTIGEDTTEYLPKAKPIKSSNALKAVGVHAYNGRNS